jgi:hypothetical protein
VHRNKINFEAKFDYEIIQNFKMLQKSFKELSITKNIDVNSLIKGNFQDNLDFLQFMKKYYDMNYKNGDEKENEYLITPIKEVNKILKKRKKTQMK